jgi:hypothetical protein
MSKCNFKDNRRWEMTSYIHLERLLRAIYGAIPTFGLIAAAEL